MFSVEVLLRLENMQVTDDTCDALDIGVVVYVEELVGVRLLDRLLVHSWVKEL